MSELEALHFLRPAWLLGVPVILLLGFWAGWRQRAERLWRGRIAPHLLAHLVVRPVRHVLPGPRAWLVSLVSLAGLALAGPSWQREAPAFAEDKGALVIVLDLAPSMNANDLAPTRLIRAKQKLGELLALRQNARTGLVVFAETAHRVMPLTDDPGVLKTYLDTMDTGLMPTKAASSQRLANALSLADTLLVNEEGAGSVLVVSDAHDFGKLDRLNENTLFWLFGDGDKNQAILSRLSYITATLEDADVNAVHTRIEQELSNAAERDDSRRWRDGGSDLLFPLLLIAALGFRRGWSVRW